MGCWVNKNLGLGDEATEPQSEQPEAPAVQSSKTGDPAWTVVSVGEAEVEQAREARRAGSRAHA